VRERERKRAQKRKERKERKERKDRKERKEKKRKEIITASMQCLPMMTPACSQSLRA
jgi:hypothetical protein